MESPARPSFHVKTFGCQMNVYDSDRMTARLEKKGFRAEPNLSAADIILINTCSIRDKAEQKVLSLLGELKGLKRKNPSKVIGVAGCVGQRMGRTLLQKVPHLDLVFGPDSVDRVEELVEAVLNSNKRILETRFDEEARRFSQPLVASRGRVAEFLTIMKGCDHFCTYCIVPFVRGREKSRTIAEILSDVQRLVDGGTREVTFLGQNINTYGKGTPETLAQLIEGADKVSGLERIRYVTSHPRDLRMDLISQFGAIEKLCPQLHLPFQAGSDPVLKRMSRLYTASDYLEKVDALRRACPEIALSTDVIVGFPGETDSDFEKTLEMLRAVRFSGVFLFKYSPRPGTKAFSYHDEVSEKAKDDRLKAAQEVAFSIIDEENKSKIGSVEKVLIESLDKKGKYFSGRSPHNKVVHVLNAGEACRGKIVDVQITEANGSNLRGYYVAADRRKRVFEDTLSASVS